MELLARKVFKIGIQSLWRADDQYFVSIQNRTYHSTVPIPVAQVPLWREALRGPQSTAIRQCNQPFIKGIDE